MINDAINRMINNGALYPDPEWTDLRSALAEVHGIDADAILCGTGSLDLIGRIAHVFVGPTRSILALSMPIPFFGLRPKCQAHGLIPHPKRMLSSMWIPFCKM